MQEKTYSNYIDGQWISNDLYTENFNPSNLDDLIGRYSLADEQQVNFAIQSARNAFPEWSRMGLQARSNILDRAGNEILQRTEELGYLLSREEGKSLVEGIAEVERSGRIFKFFAGEVLRPSGEFVNSVRSMVDVEIRREPVGVIGLITPWNFPWAIPSWKVAPALAYGNCVVLKPAELVPASVWELAKILDRAGIPPGVFNLVIGSGSVVGEVICNSPHVDAISFTGSQKIGSRIAMAAASRMAKIQLEMGGKNPLVILDDARIDLAVNCALQGSFYSTGQRCTASSRIIVTEQIHERFVEALIDKMKTVRVGDALDRNNQIGPVASSSQMSQNLEYIQIGINEGAKLAFGGEVLKRGTEGYFLSPALFTETHSKMRINREEIFGPIASIIKVKDYEEALSVANDTEFGLCAGIVSDSLKNVSNFKQRAQTGMVMVNLPTAGVDYHVPFGGRKASSHGPREQGHHAQDFYTTTKTSYIST